ncbi:hypothetical protein, partial [Aeromonas salmonicida]|uniref:hypothetical protein n=1 Tax=Aeromonas salmonicida TaxID=645 RepID=UPI001C3F4A94
WSSGRSDGVCERDKQTEHPWSACQKAPSVTVTWGWGNHDLLADLGNNAVIYYSEQLFNSKLAYKLPKITLFI